ncbi:hypothetical protein SDC9_171818 [bioreactor metagenome]|uniref:Uncharacterized protein n=1 Tax=bioreactor metagenome TaxID=1076179 RepID=A0A645GF62_9ZZZZ
MSEGFQDDKEKNGKEDENGQFIVEAEPDMGTGIAPRLEILQHPATMPMIGGENGNQGRFGMQPATTEAEAEPQPQAKQDGQYAQRRHEPIQLPCHQ